MSFERDPTSCRRDGSGNCFCGATGTCACGVDDSNSPESEMPDLGHDWTTGDLDDD